MSNAEYTPGPWERSGSKVMAATRTILIAECAGDEERFRPDSPSANARLVAAAPELLEALEIAVADMVAIANPAQKAAIRIGQAAIAKATGQELATAA